MTAKCTTKSLGIVDLLVLRGFDPTRPTKLVRHQDARYDVHDLMRRGWLDFYQATQSRPAFDRCERIVSFIGTGETKARLIGVYRVVGKHDAGKPDAWQALRPASDSAYPSAFSYTILQVLPKTFARHETLAWEQRYKEKLGSRATGLNTQ